MPHVPRYASRGQISRCACILIGSSTELVGSSGAELRHNPPSFQLKTRLLRARARERERPDIIKKHPLKTSKTLPIFGLVSKQLDKPGIAILKENLCLCEHFLFLPQTSALRGGNKEIANVSPPQPILVHMAAYFAPIILVAP